MTQDQLQPAPAQLRAARGWLRLTRPQVAHEIGLHPATVLHAENANREAVRTAPATVAKLRAFYEGRGIEFTFPGCSVSMTPFAGIRGPYA